MKFSEFRALIEKRKSLIELKSLETNNDMALEYDIQIEETEEEIFGERGNSYPKLYKLFFVETDNVQKFLQNFFKEKEIKAETGFEGYVLNLMVYIGTKGYNLGGFEENVSLRCLYMGSWNEGWKELLTDYPDLLDYLWQAYREFKVVKKTSQISLIRKQLERKQRELNFLTNPQQIKTRINELKVDTQNIETQIDTLTRELEQFN